MQGYPASEQEYKCQPSRRKLRKPDISMSMYPKSPRKKAAAQYVRDGQPRKLILRRGMGGGKCDVAGGCNACMHACVTLTGRKEGEFNICNINVRWGRNRGNARRYAEERGHFERPEHIRLCEMMKTFTAICRRHKHNPRSNCVPTNNNEHPIRSMLSSSDFGSPTAVSVRHQLIEYGSEW